MAQGAVVGGAVVVGALLAGAVATKPDREAHLAAVRAACAEKAGPLAGAGCGFALGAGDLFGVVQLEDGWFTTRLRAGDQVLSTGAFGTVWVE